MKRNLWLIIPAIMLFGCPPPNPSSPSDPYQKARTTISIMRTTLSAGKLAFDGVASTMKSTCTTQLCAKLNPDTTSQAYLNCMSADHSANVDFKACYKVGAAVPWVDAGVKIGLEGCDAADAAVQLSASLAVVREDKKLKEKCSNGDADACKEYERRVDQLCQQVDPTKGDQYKLCITGKPVAKADYTGILKTSACMAYASLKLVPANPKYDLYINAVRSWLQIYGNCQ